jgi:hypothetical protein
MNNPIPFAMLSALLLLFGCGSKTSQESNENNSTSLAFQQYENLKLGFTTQNFLQVIPVSLASSKAFIDYATAEGFAWIELRDPEATLTLEECEEIASYAREKNVEVSYAIQKGLLDEDFWSTFEKGVRNAAVFEGPKTYRSLGSGQEFTDNPDKKGWTEGELLQAVRHADSAATIATQNDLQYVIENATESFFNQSGQYYGITDLFALVSKNVGWQFDTANPFSVSRVHPSPDSVQMYLQAHADNLHYIHLKSAQNGAAQPVLMENPLDFATVFQVMNEHNIPYVAIELQAVDNEEQAYQNMTVSVAYLQKQGFIAAP